MKWWEDTRFISFLLAQQALAWLCHSRDSGPWLCLSFQRQSARPCLQKASGQSSSPQGPAHIPHGQLTNIQRVPEGIRLQGSLMGPGGPHLGQRIGSTVTSGDGRDGPGPGVRPGADGLAPDPTRTASVGLETPGEAGGAGLAAPEVRVALG